MGIMKRLRLALLRGQEQNLGRQIGAGYARGDYAAKLRREQQSIRSEIARLEGRS